MEKCLGCGAHDKRHPYLAVVVDTFGRATTHTVCSSCQRDPSHRKTRIKAGFFERSIEDTSHGAAAPVPGASQEAQLADLIVAAVSVMLKPLRKRLKLVEQRAGVSYGGIFEPSKSYDSGTLVTRHSGLWLCLRHTALAPGTAPSDWKLIVKSGGG